MIRRIIALIYGLLGIVLLAVAWYPALDQGKPAGKPGQEQVVPVKRYAVGTACSLVVLAGAGYFLRRARKADLDEPLPAVRKEEDEDEDPYQYK